MSLEEKYINILTRANYKLTKPRRLILKTLIGNPGRHLTAEEMYQLLRRQGAQVGMATIYRTLELFCELGILSTLQFGDTCRRYELERKSHHHLICITCEGITEFSDDVFKDCLNIIEAQYRFKVTNHAIKCFGYCHKCRQKEEEEYERALGEGNKKV